MKSRRRGFTLIELLVAISIVAILISLLLPAVQQAREAARRIECKSHLKQLALACHTFHGVYGHFPYGRRSNSNATWGIALLPYVDEKPLSDLFATGAISPTEPALRTVLPLFRCPSESGREIRGVSNYLGNWGAGNAIHADIMTAPDKDGGGVFSENGATGIRSIKDGTTNTLLMGEALGLASGERDHVPQQLYEWGGASIAENCGDTRLPINTGTPNSFELSNFSSNHIGGAQFSMCDGSVRFISQNINFAQTGVNSTQGLFQSLAGRRDRRIVADYFAHQ